MSSVLYDTPGPRARRRTAIGSVIAGLAILAVVALAAVRLARQGQFDADRWAPLFNPADPVFSQVWTLLGEGLGRTLLAAGLSMVLAVIVGTALAVTRLLLGRWSRLPVVGLIELFRGLPVVITLFFAYRALPELGLDLAALWYLVIGLTAYNSVIIAEIVRAGVASLPRGQGEAADALGLTRWQGLRHVLLPQAARVMLPALISQLVVVLKDTSLVVFLGGYIELLRTGTLLVQNLRNPIQVYLLIGAIFVLLNYLLSVVALRIERRSSRSHTEAAPQAAQAQSEVTTGA